MTAPPQRSVRLQFGGDELDPSIITDRLGGEPTRALRVGDPLETAGGPAHATKNIWELRVPVGDDPEGLGMAIMALLGSLTTDLSAWNELVGRYGGGLIYTIPAANPVDGGGLPAQVLRAIAERGLGLSLSVFQRAAA